MLQRLLIITLTLCSLTASAQWQQTGSKVRYVNGLGIPTKDTAAGVAADSSQILIRPADSSLYVRYKRAWQKVGAGGGISGSGTTNRIPKWTSSSALGNSSIVDSASAVAMTINPSGDVGIGTTSPSERLHLFGNTFRQNDASNSFGYTISTTSATTTLATLFGGSSFGIRTGGSGSDNFHINSTGNVGIGYTAPATKLSVNGTALINTNTDNGVDRLQVNGSALASTLKFNTSGQTTTISNYYAGGTGQNIWIGNGGASSNSSAQYNVSLGQNALVAVTSGFFNVGIGGSALLSLTSGSGNMAIGFEALPLVTSGTANTAIGVNALGNSTGSDNTAIGNAALLLMTTPSNNIGIGRDAGRRISGGGNNQTSSESVYIGNDTRSSANGNSNEIVIGHNAIGQGSNTVTLGNSSITKTFLRGNTMVNTTTDNNIDELQVNGSISGTGFKQNYVTKTGTYTATTDDYVIDCTSGTFTVNLPALVGRTGMVLIIKNSGTGTITVDPNGATVIDGAATYALSTQYATVQIISDGTNWKIIAKF
jgi:hypothetical protein